MESITIKVSEDMAKEIDSLVNPDYGTRTDFIRAAVRDKIKQERKERIFRELKKHFGKSKIKTTDEDDRKAREEVGNEILKEFGLD